MSNPPRPAPKSLSCLSYSHSPSHGVCRPHGTSFYVSRCGMLSPLHAFLCAGHLPAKRKSLITASSLTTASRELISPVDLISQMSFPSGFFPPSHLTQTTVTVSIGSGTSVSLRPHQPTLSTPFSVFFLTRRSVSFQPHPPPFLCPPTLSASPPPHPCLLSPVFPIRGPSGQHASTIVVSAARTAFSVRKTHFVLKN